MAALVERRLCANPQYVYARAIGQLGPLRPRAVEHLLDTYARCEMRRGRRLADIKPPVLVHCEEAYAVLTDREAIGDEASASLLPHSARGRSEAGVGAR
jgi:hypothetical protein